MDVKEKQTHWVNVPVFLLSFSRIVPRAGPKIPSNLKALPIN
jgi:hypothetical protein